jgi:hypothetical protein
VRHLLALQAAVAGIIAKDVEMAMGPRLDQRLAIRIGLFEPPLP